MRQVAFKMKLKPGYEDEYKKRHDAIWPELKILLSESGIYDYSIFLDEETLTLFAVHKLRSNHTADDLAAHPVMQKWWAYMADIMETHTDQSPATLPLNPVFHMD